MLVTIKSWTIESLTCIPTLSLCLSSVLEVFLQPGCQTVDPEGEDEEHHETQHIEVDQ